VGADFGEQRFGLNTRVILKGLPHLYLLRELARLLYVSKK
jgi:hypothetical protein